MSVLQTGTLVAATLATGLSAGLFTTFSYAVMPGLRRSDDRAFIEVMQRINVAIINPWFLVCFLGALALPALAMALHLSADQREVLPWIIAGLVLYSAVIVITAAVNVPLNNQLAAAGPVDRIADPATVRERFEARWVRWNVARSVASSAAFGCLVWALVQHSRTLS